MNRFEKKNAIEKIRGYYLPWPGETVVGSYKRAKKQAVENMIIALSNVELISFEDFKEEMAYLGRPVE